VAAVLGKVLVALVVLAAAVRAAQLQPRREFQGLLELQRLVLAAAAVQMVLLVELVLVAL
jgi:hypothetical protein